MACQYIERCIGNTASAVRSLEAQTDHLHLSLPLPLSSHDSLSIAVDDAACSFLLANVVVCLMCLSVCILVRLEGQFL